MVLGDGCWGTVHRARVSAQYTWGRGLGSPSGETAKAPNARLKVAIARYKLRDTEYGRPGPLSNAFFILLRLNRPRYLKDGTLIPLGEISNRRDNRDKHHIFPKDLLNDYGLGPERSSTILNICYLTAAENRSVGRRIPRHYLNDVPCSKRARSLAMRSHFIPSKDGQGVWDPSIRRGFKAFLEGRTGLLVRAFEQKADMRFFERE
jgi:hypothetical protein